MTKDDSLDYMMISIGLISVWVAFTFSWQYIFLSLGIGYFIKAFETFWIYRTHWIYRDYIYKARSQEKDEKEE